MNKADIKILLQRVTDNEIFGATYNASINNKL